MQTAPPREERGEAEVGRLAVEPTVRGRRIGEVVELLRRARARGLARTVLSTQPTMLSAHRLYERLGFRRVSERDWARRSVPRLGYTLDLWPSSGCSPTVATTAGS